MCAPCCRISELTHDLESAQKSLSERENDLVRCEQQNGELESKLREQQSRGDELQRLLTKSRAKNEELARIKHEIETVLVEQEQQVTTYEEQVKQMEIERESELESAQQMITSLRAECQSERQRIDVLDGVVRQLRDELEREKSAAVARDDSSRTGIRDRDAMIAKLKALVRENQSTADQVKDELRKMNAEAKEKNRTIAKLRRSCEELGARCAELEAALCRTSLDASHHPSEMSLRSSGQFLDSVSVRPSSDHAGSVSSEPSVEVRRHAQDYDEENVEPRRQRQLSAALVLPPADEDTTFMSGDSRFLQQPHHSAVQDNCPQSDGAGGKEILAGSDGCSEAEQTAVALSAARQQLLRQVICSVFNLAQY